MSNLKKVPCGKSAIVRQIDVQGTLKRRIMDMGITKGVEVTVKKVAPLGDPIEICVRGYSLTLRKEDAQSILVELV